MLVLCSIVLSSPESVVCTISGARAPATHRDSVASRSGLYHAVDLDRTDSLTSCVFSHPMLGHYEVVVGGGRQVPVAPPTGKNVEGAVNQTAFWEMGGTARPHSSNA